MITIAGRPIALARPRFSKNGVVYNSQKELMEKIAFFIKFQYNGPVLTGPLKITITFYMQIPKSYSKKKNKLFMNQYHDRKSDIDNLEKLCYDCIGLSGAIFGDDSQIAEVKSAKVWSNNPRTEFTVEQIDYEFDKAEFWAKD